MKIAIDTNRYSDLVRHVPDVVEVVATAEAVFLPFIVVAELKYGFRKGSRQSDNERNFARFMTETPATILFPDLNTLDQFGLLKLQLRRQGTPIPDHDIWIAASVIQHQIPLFARDAHFDHLPQIQRV